MTKIKKLIMENFGVFRGKHEIEFSTDEKNRITVIVGTNGSGKTTILNALRNGFGCNMILRHEFQQRDYYKDAKSSVEISGQKLEIHPNEEILYFLDGETLDRFGKYGLAEGFRNFSLDQTVIDEMNNLLRYSGRLSRECSGFRLVDSEIQLLSKSGYDMIRTNAAGESRFVNLITLIALQKKHNTSFFVLDSIFGRADRDHANQLCELLFRECKQQLIFLVTDTEYFNNSSFNFKMLSLDK